MSVQLINQNGFPTSACPAFDVPRGGIPGIYSVNKFGETTNADSGIATDIWDRANPTNNQAMWLAPTAARIHAIVSTSANDAVAGTGCSSIQLWGLTSWDAEEVSEIVILEGATPVNTINSYVIIHRMKGLGFGSGNTNDGDITATAATDSTVTAQISAGNGQTLMAVYGVPSARTAYMPCFDFAVVRTVAAIAEMTMFVNEDPSSNPKAFITKHTYGYDAGSTSSGGHKFDPYKKITGPAIIKFQVLTNTNNTIISGGFDLYMEIVRGDNA